MKFGQLINVTWETFFSKNHAQNVVEKLVPGPSMKNYKCPYLWINGLKFYTVCFYFMANWELSKNIETKLQNTCFQLILSFFKK